MDRPGEVSAQETRSRRFRGLGRKLLELGGGPEEGDIPPLAPKEAQQAAPSSGSRGLLFAGHFEPGSVPRKAPYCSARSSFLNDPRAPGRPSTSRLPLASRPMSSRSTIASWPMIDLAHAGLEFDNGLAWGHRLAGTPSMIFSIISEMLSEVDFCFGGYFANDAMCAPRLWRMALYA